jgi:hypothetical protein
MDQYLTLDIAHLLIFTIPGFFTVWAFNQGRGRKIENEFEYLMFSFSCGFVLLLLWNVLMTKENFSNLFENIYATTVFLSITGALFGFALGGAEKIENFIKWIFKKFKK